MILLAILAARQSFGARRVAPGGLADAAKKQAARRRP
jgi:hypothetical protein